MNHSKKLKILFTEGSSVSARQAIYTLGHEHTIDILDPSPFCQSRFSSLIRRWIRCPSLSKDPLAYLEFLVQRLQAEQYDVLLPIHEQVFLLSRVRDQLSEYVGLAIPEFELIDQIHSKTKFSRLCDELEIPQPQSTIVNTRQEFEQADLPCYVKLAYGTAGAGVIHVQDEQHLKETAEKLEAAGVFEQPESVLVQEPVSGQHEAVGGYYQHGKMVSSGGFRVTMQGVGGGTMAMESYVRPEALEHVKRLGEHLNWHGPMGFGYIYDPADGKSKFYDANPRLGGTMNTSLSGVNVADAIINVALDTPMDPIPVGNEGVRTHQAFVNRISLATAGENRFTILGDAWRAWRGKGIYQNSEDELTRPSADWMSLIPSIAVTLLILAYPNAANWLVRRTVENYSVAGDTANVIRNIPEDDLLRCFR